MKGIKSKFNIMDFLIVFSLILVIASSAIQGIAVKKFEGENKITKATVVLALTDLDEMGFSLIERNDEIYAKEKFGYKPMGKVVMKQHTSTGTESSEGESVGVHFKIEVATECVVNNDGFYSINNEFVAPGMKFCADNGNVRFSCEVLSVKIS